MSTARDPREIITQDAFRVAPGLLGMPLARPGRRAAAMALDGVFIALLSNAPSILLGLAAALVLFRVSSRPTGGSYLRYSGRLVFRFWGAVLLFIVVIKGWSAVSDGIEGLGGEEPEAASVEVETASAVLTGMPGLRMAADIALLPQSETEEEALERARRIIPAMRESGASEEDIREMLAGFAEAPGKPWMAAAMDSAITLLEVEDPDTVPEPAGDSLVVAYAAALSAGDTARAAELRSRLALSLAQDTIDELHDELREVERDRVSLAARLDEAREEAEEGPGILAALGGLADDLGLGFGWAGLYFTTCLVLWQGRTGGKRIMGIRVIRLDGKPIGWWAAFERFGGYAAGLATGLLGYFQILWDRNRQAVHDKIAETVVIRG